ncbi:MAG TPA: ROK family protein [Pyrinomonadaceae bacterium]|nr:ROK family protein [Pyrinomonadaceae bacterium]
MEYAVGIDLGGTNIKAVAVNESGEVLGQSDAETQDDGDGGAWASRVRDQITTIEDRVGQRPAWVGIASPGMVALDGRSMASVSGHLESLQGFDWVEYLQSKRKVELLNDAHAALLGEAWKGAAAGARDAVMLTLGTGVGGAVLSGGQLLTGHLGRGGHIGHICLDADGEPDSLGIPGTLEEAVGNRTLAKRSSGLFHSTEQLVAAHLAGDANASRVWLRSIYQLSCAVTSMINVLDPEVVIIGGGIARAGAALFDPLSQYLDVMEWRPLGQGVRVVPAALGPTAGALGAAHNAMQSSR